MPQTFSAATRSDAEERFDFAAARYHMIEGQLRPNGVVDPKVLAVMGQVPRECFVPSSLVGVAYTDQDVPLLDGRALLQPMVLGRLIQAAEIGLGEMVLDLAPATGYSTAVLSALATSVTAVEAHPLLFKEAKANIARFASGKAVAVEGAPEAGCSAHAPYDVVLINGLVDVVPQILFDQMAEGGRLLAVVSKGRGLAAHAVCFAKNRGAITEKSLFEATAQPVPGFGLPAVFSF